tara:strand:- start:10684 stop:11229 length:546 start_codon:yes stop_codon:yes gene_type:complete
LTNSNSQSGNGANPIRSLIVARAQNGIIGRDGDMPWRLSSDLKRFKALTTGKPIIMGRKTWESLPRKPLPGRPNIVVSRNSDYVAEGAWLASNMTIAYAMASAMAGKAGVDEVFVIGGAGLYNDAILLADRLHITEVEAEIEGDTSFPAFNESDWVETVREAVPAGEKDDYPTVYRQLDRK